MKISAACAKSLCKLNKRSSFLSKKIPQRGEPVCQSSVADPPSQPTSVAAGRAEMFAFFVVKILPVFLCGLRVSAVNQPSSAHTNSLCPYYVLRFLLLTHHASHISPIRFPTPRNRKYDFVLRRRLLAHLNHHFNVPEIVFGASLDDQSRVLKSSASAESSTHDPALKYARVLMSRMTCRVRRKN